MKTPPVILTVLSITSMNPTSADSLLLINSENGHSYQRFDTVKTWNEAKDSCSQHGAYLATITSESEHNWLFNNGLTNPSPIWLGATDDLVEGQWQWITGETWNYTNWAPDEPNNYQGKENNLTTYRLGTAWNDANGGEYARFLCEWNVSTPAVLKLSWTIPAVNNCSSNRFNITTRKLKSKICFNNINGSTVNVYAVGKKSRMTVFVNPTDKNSSYFYKMTFPSALKISSATINNSKPLQDAEKDQIAGVFTNAGKNAVSTIFGPFNYPLISQIPINTQDNNSFIKLLAAQKGSNSLLSKQLYPYQNFEKHFQKNVEKSAITITLESDITFTTFKSLVTKYGISVYFGGNPNNELLVESMTPL